MTARLYSLVGPRLKRRDIHIDRLFSGGESYAPGAMTAHASRRRPRCRGARDRTFLGAAGDGKDEGGAAADGQGSVGNAGIEVAGVAGIQVDAFVATTIALGTYAAAFLSEIWRGAIDAIPRQQWEASESLGLSRLQTLIDVILPQAIRGATPPSVGFLVQLVKDTSLASVIGFVELTRAAQLVNNATFQSFVIFGTIGVLYFMACFPLTVLSRRLERSAVR